MVAFCDPGGEHGQGRSGLGLGRWGDHREHRFDAVGSSFSFVGLQLVLLCQPCPIAKIRN